MVPFVEIAYAADSAAFVQAISPIVRNIINPLVILLFSVAVLIFVYGVVEMIIGGGDEERLTRGKHAMVGGVIGLFIMLSAWGIIYLISGTLKTL